MRGWEILDGLERQANLALRRAGELHRAHRAHLGRARHAKWRPRAAEAGGTVV